ncbi:transporter [Arthrobacter monumenti]
MVADLVRLKLALLANSLRRSKWQLVGVIIGGLYGLSLLTGVVAGLVALSFAEPELTRTVVVLAGSAVVLGWMLIPLVAGGVDMTLDPARFVTFAIPLHKLLAGLMLASLVGVPGIVTLIAALATTASWWKYPLPLVAAPVCALLAVFTCIVLSRLVTSATATLASSRRFKDVSGIVAFIPLVLLGPIIGSVATGIENARAFLPALAETMSWTPLGAAWSVPADLALGFYGAAAGKFLIAAGTLALLVWIWKISLARALVTPVHSAVARKSAGNLGFFARFPGTPTGAVAARSLTYWVRDPRYGASLIMVPVLPVLLIFAGSQSGDFGLLSFLGPFAAVLLVWSISADVSYDNTAFWMHVSSGVSGIADRTGRVLACAAFALPVSLLFVVLPLWLNDSWNLLPAMLGLTLGVLLTGLGLASVVSARYTYNVPAPGDSPFKTPPGSGVRTILVQFVGWLTLAVLIAPELVLALISIATGAMLFGWLALGAGLVLGAVFLVLGIRIGGRWFDRRTPELLLAVSHNK